MRHRGMSIGKVAEDLIGRTGEGHLLAHHPLPDLPGHGCVRSHGFRPLHGVDFYPESVFPTFSLIGIAMIIGWLVYKRGVSVVRLTVIGFVLMLASIANRSRPSGRPDLGGDTWIVILLVYAFAASTSAGLGPSTAAGLPELLAALPGPGHASYCRPVRDAARIRRAGARRAVRRDAPPIFPFVFIVIACGAISGFHGLVSSGTTSKQIDKETDALADRIRRDGG